MDRNRFFAELDQLTPSQIEAWLPSWDREQLKLVEEYLERGTIRPAQKAAIEIRLRQHCLRSKREVGQSLRVAD